ncbi:MarR family transcriptional regulator [bacterium]|nr:MAG: MarR family transcriptional regulator [bacterium]
MHKTVELLDASDARKKISEQEAAAHGNLSAPAHRAWGSLLLSHAHWTARIEKRLNELGALSLESYDVLLILSYAPNCRLKMGELYDAVTLSRSGLTRLVDRLERDNLVRREVCSNDRRSFEAILTDEGEAERARCWPIYAEILAEEFACYFSDSDANELTRLLERPLKGEHIKP